MAFEPGAPTPKRSEVLDVVQAVMSTLNEVITALRLEVAALADSETRRSKRLSVYLGMIGVIVIASISGVVLNYQQGRNVKTVVTYIKDCQDPAGKCKQQGDAAIAGAVASISAKAFDSITCVLLHPPTERTDANVKACRDKYLK